MLLIDLSNYASLTRLCTWFLDDVLPVWFERGWDVRSEHFHEGLALDGGSLASAKLRIRTSARMIHVFAEAELLGVLPAAATGVATKAFAALERQAHDPLGGYVRAIDRTTGTVVDPIVDLYDQACVLLACASLYSLTRDVRYREKADDILSTLDRRLASPSGGWIEDTTGSLPRRQNPHMHVFEALAVLHSATGDIRHLARLQELGELMRAKFLDDSGILREFFGPDWEVDNEWGSDCLDPGHMAEWAWLLFAAGSDVELSNGLLSCALRVGSAQDDDRFLADTVSLEAKTSSDGRRLWPQVELIKAHLATGNFDRADKIAAAMFETYLAETPRGTWRDRFDLSGRSCSDTIPASSCYHLWTLVGPLCNTTTVQSELLFHSNR